MYATFESGTWRRASPAYAAEIATTANNGAKVSPSALNKLPDKTLVAWGVRRLDKDSTPTLQLYQDFGDGSINPAEDRAVQSWVVFDKSLDNAKQEALDKLATIATHKRTEDVKITQDGVDYEFPMDSEKVHHYMTLGAALGSGVGFPSTGVSFVVKQEGQRKRLRVNQVQWQSIVQAMAGALILINEREEALEDLIETAKDLTALRAINLEANW